MKKLLPNPLNIISEWFRKEEIRRPAASRKAGSKPKAKTEKSHTEQVTNAITEMEAALTRMEQEGTAAIAGRVQVLRFDQLRKELGNKWERYSERIERVIEGSIDKQLAPSDMRWQLGPHAHVLIFNSVTPAEAEVKCGLIRAQVEEFFRGTPQLAGKIVVETAVAAVDGTIKLKSIEDLDTLYGRLNLAKKAKAEDVKDKEKSKPKSKDPQQTNKKKPPPKEEVVNWRAVTDNVDTAREKIESVEFLEHLVWDTKNKEIVGRAVNPQDPIPESIGRSGSILTEWAGGSMTFAMDEAALVAMKKLQSTSSTTDHKSVWFQTHLGSYENQKFRDDLLKGWEVLDKSKSDERILEIIGIPKKQQIRPNKDQLNALSVYVEEMAVCLDLVSPQFDMIQQANFQWAGFTMRDTRLDENTAMDAIAEFVSLASKHNVKLYARDIPTENLVMAAIGFGVRYIIGNPQHSGDDRSPHTYRVEDLWIGDT